MNYLPIAFIADKNFFIPTAVAITSLLENKQKSSNYLIYIVCVGFTSEQKEIIKEIASKYETEIRIIEIEEKQLWEKYSSLAKHDCNATVSALIKFDLPFICDTETKLLYLDGDIVIKEDLMALSDIDLGDNNYVAAVRDSGLLYSERLIRQGNPDYFNSGVMLLNLDAMRRDGLPEKLVDTKLNATDNSLMDQHVLNQVFGTRKVLIDYKYNVLYVNLWRAHYFHKLALEKVNEFCLKDYKEWEDILDQAVIVHYSSFDKPWKYSDVTGGEVWDYYYQLSPVKNQKLNRKKLHIQFLNKMQETKGLALLANFLWEWETKGFSLAMKDVFGFFKSKGQQA